jgi:hypothetical protein
VEQAFKLYDSSWDLEVLRSKKNPILLITTGVMNQQPTVTGFLGTAVEEKFHLIPLSLSVLPCVPLISIGLKDMVHPDIGPIQLSEGDKEGYFRVNLSTNQDFSNGPEYFGIYNENDDFGNIKLNSDTKKQMLILLFYI